MKRYGLPVLLALLVGSGGMVMLGEPGGKAGLGSVMEIWSDVLRDADQLGLQLTRISDEEEMEFGLRLAARYRPSPRLEDWESYVTDVAGRLAPHLGRQGIRYWFHVIDSPSINAFALPGGQIFVFTGMLNLISSEAELAALLGHEMAHVDLRHTIELAQYQLAARKLGLEEAGQLVDFTRRMLNQGYKKYRELEADAQGVRMSIQAGYLPSAGRDLFTKLHGAKPGRVPAKPPATPLEELVRALEKARASYNSSHPLPLDRAGLLHALTRSKRMALEGQMFYEGRKNHRLRKSRDTQEFPGEFVRLSLQEE